MDTLLLLQDLNRAYGLELASAAAQALETQLAEKVNTMIREDFGRLLQLLYRIDVSEQRLRRLLAENTGEDAGMLIARLIMERQWQKIQSRRQYGRDSSAEEAGGEERW